MRILRLAFVLLFIAPAAAFETDGLQSPITRDEAIGNSIQDILRASTKSEPAHKLLFEDMLAFYKERGGVPIWIEGDRFTRKAREARGALARAEEFGLNPA